MTTHRCRLAAAAAFTIAGGFTATAAIFSGAAATPGVAALIAAVAAAAVLLGVAAVLSDGTLFQAAPFSVMIFLPLLAAAAMLCAPHLASAHAERHATELLTSAAPATRDAAGIHAAVISTGAGTPTVTEVAPDQFNVAFALDTGPTFARRTMCVTARYSPNVVTVTGVAADQARCTR